MSEISRADDKAPTVGHASDWVGLFLRSAAYTAFQRPMDRIVDMVNVSTGAHLHHVEIIDPPPGEKTW